VNGRQPTSIELSSPEEDASRRDFTINGMFYDPLENIVYDYISGRADLHARVIRTIGDPYARFNEDRLRMIRALRFAARFNFLVDIETEEAIRANADQLFPAVAIERVWQEFNKMAKFPNFDQALIQMHRLELLGAIFPQLKSLHLTELKHRVIFFSKYLKETPTIWYLSELFPEMTLEAAKELCLYLHTSLADSAVAAFLIQLRQEIQLNSFDKPMWVILYAHPLIHSALHMIGLKLQDTQQFIEIHKERMQILEKPIQRQIRKSPLVNAARLQAHGIMPGKQMGILLKEAERLAIIHDICEPELVIELLKQTQKWKNSSC